MKKASFLPDEMVEGGGILDDADVTIKDIKFGMSDYNGAIDEEVGALLVTFEDDDEEEHEQILSAGKGKPSKDGKSYMVETGLNSGTNAGLFISSLFECEPSVAKHLKDDISVLEGMKLHVIRKAPPKGRNTIQRDDDEGGGRGKTILVASDVISCPWDKGGKKAGSKKGKVADKKTAKGKKSKSDDDDEEEEEEEADGDDTTANAKTVLLAALDANNGEITKLKLTAACYSIIKKKLKKFAGERADIVKTINDPKFLKTQDGWAFDGKKVTAGEGEDEEEEDDEDEDDEEESDDDE